MRLSSWVRRRHHAPSFFSGGVTGALALALVIGCDNASPPKDNEQPGAALAFEPEYSQEGKLMLPTSYREWVFLSSSLGLTYGPSAPPPDAPELFDTVFVPLSSYRAFLQSGTWPDPTMLLLELRRSYTPESVQSVSSVAGEIVSIEANVKDIERFGGDGWRFFTFATGNGITDRASPIETTAGCYTCHAANTAVDNTFVQFYPTLFKVAEDLGTIRPDWDPTQKF